MVLLKQINVFIMLKLYTRWLEYLLAYFSRQLGLWKCWFATWQKELKVSECRDEKDASWLRHKLLKLWQVFFDFDSFVFTGRETSLFGVHEKNKTNERFSLCQLHFIVSLCWRLMDRSHLKHCRFRRKAKTLRATSRFGFTLGCCLPHFKHRNYYRRYFYIRKGKK